MMRNAQRGERCRITPRSGVGLSQWWDGGKGKGKLAASFDPRLCNTGTVERVRRFSSNRKRVYVTLDPPNLGVMPFSPSELERIDSNGKRA